MFKFLGFGQVTGLEAWTIVLVATALALIIGWVIDLVTEQTGFGVFGNSFVCLLGIMVALIVFQHYVGELSVARLPLVVAFASASVTVHMFMLIYVRRALKL
jgi:hypothetical protein